MKFRFLLCLSIVACGRDSEKIPESVAPPAPAPLAAVAPTASPSGCPHTGAWAICNVEQRLKQSGFVAKRLSGESSPRAGFTVTPVVYSLGRARLEVFIYNDEAALARDIAKLDTVRVAPAGTTGSWGEVAPLLIRSGNLAAVYLGDNPQQAERLTLALTAGAPQPGSPR
jgi:hypothetical protein